MCRRGVESMVVVRVEGSCRRELTVELKVLTKRSVCRGRRTVETIITRVQTVNGSWKEGTRTIELLIKAGSTKVTVVRPGQCRDY